jgi:flagellar biogenesis protein FliO
MESDMDTDIMKERLELIESTTTLLTTGETKQESESLTCIPPATRSIQEGPDEAKKNKDSEESLRAAFVEKDFRKLLLDLVKLQDLRTPDLH